MSKTYLLPAWIILIFFLASAPALAQKSKTKGSSGVTEYLDDKGNFASHLWYGGNFNLGFSGNSYYSLFNLGIAPMVGYKIIEPLSVGPRASIQYSFVKGYATDGNIHKVQPLSYSIAAFARFKFFRSIFAHLEYEYENAELPYFSGPYLYYDAAQAKVATARVTRDNLYIGAGYNASNGGWGYEIMVLYNALSAPDALELPFLIRFGITYKY
ncbi:MAG: hypothetical protein IPL49_06465 [Saprospirales bacterium]|nr:hypothetical protein [Saprospirales bacterium]